MTASTINGRDQITAATLGGGAHTTASYLGETQTTMLTANNGTFTTKVQRHHARLDPADRERYHRVLRPHPRCQLIAATTGSSSAYYLTDNLGSTVGIVNGSGVKTAAYAYDPYGRTRTATGPTAAANAFHYAGGLFDTTTGATKFGARYYDPNTGRFTQPDPSGQEHNPYAYAGNNPITYSDPTGLDWGDVGSWIGGVVGGVAGLAACSVSYVGAVGCVATSAALGETGSVGGGFVFSSLADEEVESSDVVNWAVAGAAGPVTTGIYLAYDALFGN